MDLLIRYGDPISFFNKIRNMFGSDEPSVRFDDGEKIVVEKGSSVLQAALDNNIDLENFCGGCCSCSTCRVEVIRGGGNLSKIQPDEADILGENRVANGDRLSCQAKITGEVHVRIPDLF